MTGTLPGIYNATGFADTLSLVPDSKSMLIAATPATDCVQQEFQSPHA